MKIVIDVTKEGMRISASEPLSIVEMVGYIEIAKASVLNTESETGLDEDVKIEEEEQ